MQKKATIKDVAARAGVSVATVSNVINHSANVKENTRKVVLNAIKQLNYHPNKLAQGFKTGKKHTIGLIIPEINNSFFSSLVENIEMLLQKHQYQIIIVNTHENFEQELNSIRLFTSGLVDGFIIASATDDYQKLFPLLTDKGNFPIVFLERNTNTCPFDSVIISDYDAITNGMEYFIERGHQNIGLIYQQTAINPISERIRAYHDVLQKYNIPHNDNFIRKVANHTFDAMDDLADMGCTAVIASTNKVTMDTMLYFLNRNHTIQNEMEWMGFLIDDYTSSSLNNMPLILYPIKELALQSVKLLFRRIKEPESSIRNTILMSRFSKPQ